MSPREHFDAWASSMITALNLPVTVEDSTRATFYAIYEALRQRIEQQIQQQIQQQNEAAKSAAESPVTQPQTQIAPVTQSQSSPATVTATPVFSSNIASQSGNMSTLEYYDELMRQRAEQNQALQAQFDSALDAEWQRQLAAGVNTTRTITIQREPLTLKGLRKLRLLDVPNVDNGIREPEFNTVLSGIKKSGLRVTRPKLWTDLK